MGHLSHENGKKVQWILVVRLVLVAGVEGGGLPGGQVAGPLDGGRGRHGHMDTGTVSSSFLSIYLNLMCCCFK